MNFLKVLWKKWLKIGHVIGDFQAQVILTLFYFIFVTPFAIGLKLFSDPLKLGVSKSKARTNFGVWKHPKETIVSAKRQF